jgi:hypothetical protein
VEIDFRSNECAEPLVTGNLPLFVHESYKKPTQWREAQWSTTL